MQITNGSVTFGRSIRPADFENKRAEVTLAFVVEEGETPEEAITKAGEMAQRHCMELLRKPESIEAKSEQRDTSRAATHPAVMDEEAKASLAQAAKADTGFDPLEEDDGDKPDDVTDADLMRYVTEARARGVTPEQIKKLISRHVAKPGMPLISIPMPKRWAFVEALRLEKAAHHDG
jgi:hypothetical protein